MGFSVTAAPFQMDGIGHPSPTGVVDRIAGFVRAFENFEPLPTVLEHLWHERQPVQSPLLVQCGKDLFLAQNLNPLSGLVV